MKRLEQLKEIADETLAGLEAGPALRRRILEQRQPQRRIRPVRRWVAIAVSCALVLAVGLTAVPQLRSGNAPAGGMQVGSLGGAAAANERASLEPGKTILTITRNNVNKAQGILGNGILRVNGRYYRQLKGITVDASALGASQGAVQEQNGDVTLSGADLVSSTVPVGTEIYSVNGMGSTLVACRSSNGILVFQRVSYAGTARVGGERSLSDVLQVRGHVTAMSLTGRGMVEGSEAERLFGILADNADFEGNGDLSGRQVLIIALDNGAAVQLSVSGDRIGGCGVWTCPEFIDSFPDN